MVVRLDSMVFLPAWAFLEDANSILRVEGVSTFAIDPQ